MRILPLLPAIVALILGSSTSVKADDHGHDDDHHQPSAASETHADEGEHEEEDHGQEAMKGGIDWGSGRGVNLGGFVYPELFVSGVFGDSTTDPADLAVADHDPQESAVLHSFHIAGIVMVDDWLTGFVNYEGASAADGTFNGVVEEGFAHLHPFDGMAIGGGQFLNSFGFQNERHVHAWNFVDQYLVNGRMLNEGELTTRGGEVILDLPTAWQSTLTIGGGVVRPGHAGEEHHESGSEFDADEGNFADGVLTGNYRADYGSQDHMAGTASFAIGENGFGEMTQVYGVGHEIVWNPTTSITDAKGVVTSSPAHGGAFGAGSLRWRTEAMFRSIEAISSDDDHEEDANGHSGEESEDSGQRRNADLDEFGIYSMLQYGLCDQADLAFRAEWVSGIDEMGLADRWRLSPALTTYLNQDRTIHTRLQYNYDRGDDFGTEHSIWLQIGISWGGAPASHEHEH